MAPRVFKGNTKRCNCPIHQGEFIPLENFWIFKKGNRAGKPMSRCIAGVTLQRGRDPKNSGFIPLSKPVVRNVLLELERRLGRAEMARRIGVGSSFWWRIDNGLVKSMRKSTWRRCLEALIEVRQKGEVRHRKSIRRGSYVRGEKELVPEGQRDFYVPTGDIDNEMRRKNRKENIERERTRERERKRRQAAERRAAA